LPELKKESPSPVGRALFFTLIRWYISLVVLRCCSRKGERGQRAEAGGEMPSDK